VTTLPVWWDDPADGPTNMAADECLAEEAVARGGPVVRLYGWTATTVSLGAFQRIADARAEPAISGVAVVRRPSGGGAIVHGSDLTYAAAVPRDHPLGGRPQAFYTAFHAALVELLADLGVAARLSEAAGGPDSFFCFDRRAEGDVVVARTTGPPAACDAKVLGSAQRRLAAAVVQHGSLLLHRNRDVGPSAGHPGLADLVPEFQPASAVRPLVERWLAAVADALGAAVVAEPGPSGDPETLRERAQAFAAPRWIDRR